MAPASSDTDAIGTGPLAGLVVLEMTRQAAGSYGALILADLGARVIKIELSERAEGRAVPEDPASAGNTEYLFLNRNKESCRLNLRSREGRELLGRLIVDADAVISDLPMAERERLEIGSQWVAKLQRVANFR